MPKAPFFSIVIPTYNRADLLGETLDSLLAQTFGNFEIIVVDDGSTDHTQEVLRLYESKIIAVTQVNKGAEAARHLGAAHARGEYLVLLDHDDLLLPHALATYARIIHSGDVPPALLIAKLCRFRDGDPVPAPENATDFIQILRYRDYFSRDRSLAETCSQILIKRSIAEKHQALRSKQTAFPYDSCDILLALAACSPCVAILHPITVAYRYHAGNSSGSLDYMVKMAPRLLNLTRQRSYPGDQSHQFARYANLGGIMLNYLKQCMKAGKFKLALKLALDSWPMLAASFIRKLSLQSRKRQTPMMIKQDSSI